MAVPAPKFRRRKADRPAEIVRAALEVFVEKGFAAARLDEIAARAGVSKGAIYLYFPNKTEVFRAVVAQAIAPNLAQLRAMVASHPGPFADLAIGLARQIGRLAQQPMFGGVVKTVVGEARNFPELARVWHDDLASQALGALSDAVAAAQARGEVRQGDPRAFAMALVAPALMSVLWRETFVPVGAQPFDIPAVIDQHVTTMLAGMQPQGAAS